MSSRPTVSHADTLRVYDACLCLHAQRAARVLARRFDHALRPFNLTNQQFSLLMALNRPVPPAMAQVASELLLDRTTLTAALKPLLRRALVHCGRDRLDARVRRLSLTAKAGQLLGRALPCWEATQAEIQALLPPAAGSILRALGTLPDDQPGAHKVASP